MKTITLSLLAAAALLSAGAAQADEALAKAKNCLACHQTDKKIVGPSYKDVAKKYAGQKDAEAKLADKVIKGGSGVWARCRCRRTRRSNPTKRPSWSNGFSASSER